MSDPVTFVTVLGKKKHTATHKKTLNCTFDHLMFFEFQMTPEEFFHGKAKLEVFDANSISRGVEIGTAEIDLGFVYNQQGHEIYRTWLALTDKSGRHSGIQVNIDLYHSMFILLGIFESYCSCSWTKG